MINRLRNVLPVLALVLATAFWGSSFFTVGRTLDSTNPYMLLVLRFGAATLLVVPMLGARLLRIPASTWRAGAICGTVICGGYLFNTMGLVTLESSVSGFITALYVPFTPLLMWLFYSKAPKPSSILGVLVAFAGMVILAGPFSGEWKDSYEGELITLGSALLSAVEILLVGRYAPHCEPREFAFTQLISVTFYSLAIWVLLNAAGVPMKETVFDSTLFTGILWLAVIVAFVQVLLGWGQKTVAPDHAAIIFSMESVFAAVIGYIAGERLGINGFVGGGLIVAAVFISELKCVERGLDSLLARLRRGLLRGR